MKASFFFADKDGFKIEEKTYDVDYLPRIGETILTAPGVTPEFTPAVTPPNPPGLWLVYKVQYLLDNHGKLGYATIYAKHQASSQ